ncbi:Tryptamine 5-hydroxylase-like protein, partial [Drosera capensis]
VDLSELLFALANDVVCRAAFGRRFEGGGRGLVDVLTETQELFAGFCLGDFFPRWRWLDVMTGYRKRLERNLSDLRRVCDEIIQEHLMKNKENGGDEGEDFVDVLLRAQRQEDLEIPITDDNLKALVMVLAIHSFVSSNRLSDRYDVLDTGMGDDRVGTPPTCNEEVRRVASKGGGGKGGGGVEESHLQELHYMKAAIKEAMRIHPPVPLLVPRESMESCKLDGYYIPARTRILINTYTIGRDPESWDDPLEFRPERFLNTDIDFKGQDFRFLPVGGGRRGCPGFSFALATVEFALARLLYHFDWELPPGVEADTLDLSETFGLAMRKKTPLVLVPKLNKDYPIRGQIIDQ